MSREPNLPNDNALYRRMLHEAHVAVATAISVTGRQVPYELEQRAGELLAALWLISSRYGVEPSDWAAVAALPTSCIDVLVAVERRPRVEGDES